MRVGFDAREGLTLHQVSLRDRPVLYRASIPEMVVPYGDPKFRSPEILRELVSRGDLGVKSGRGLHGDSGAILSAGRDRQMIALLQHLGLMPRVDDETS